MRKELTTDRNKIQLSLRPGTMAFCLVLPIALGGISALASGNIQQEYFFMNKPAFFPPAYIFPFVWTVLYVCMGIALYLVLISNASEKEMRHACLFFALKMALNFTWPILFFRESLYLFAFFWSLGLCVLVAITMVSFYRINKAAGILMIPYLGWTVFAVFLNYVVYIISVTPMPLPR